MGGAFLMQYIVIKNHASARHNGMELIGSIIDLPERIGQPCVEKKLLRPFSGRITKENKNFAKIVKAEIVHDAGMMFFVRQGDKVIDRLPKKKAKQLADDINNSL